MATLTFADSHNKMAYLEKSEANANFAEIVDFLNASSIRYALTGKVFSGTVTPLFPSMLASQVVEGEGSGQPTKPQHTPTTASPSHVAPIPTIASSSHHKKTHKRRKTKSKVTKIPQSSEHTNLDAYEVVHEERGGNVEKGATTATSLDAEQGSGGSPMCQEAMGDTIAQTRSERVFIPSYDSPLLGFNTPGSDEERIELKELMDMCTKLSDMVLDLENVKDAQALEIKKLKKRVKKLEKKKKSRTPQLKRRLFKVMIESSAEKSLKTRGSAPIAIAGVSVSTAKPSTPPTTTTTFIVDEDLTIAQTLMKMRSVKSKENSKEKGVSGETATRLTRGVIIKEASETATRPIVPPQQQLDPKDKGKRIMQEPEKPVKVKGKDQIEYDVDMAKRLQAELDEEVRLEREREEEASNVALIEERDTIEARIDADA
ncbi:hypothetical protein Tco_0152808 [Tanacetum coccineum]